MEAPITKPLRLVAMTLAGGRVGELSVLTLRRPKSALPFAGYYRVIDFPLSNLMRAGIHNVGILSQYRPASLIDHVGVGESWDFVGLGRGAKILPVPRSRSLGLVPGKRGRCLSEPELCAGPPG